MKLSEAIRMNGMMKPQGFGERSIGYTGAPCVIGGALQIVGKQNIADWGANYGTVLNEWPWVSFIAGLCPVEDCWYPREAVEALSVIFHLNDQHRWTRQQIADWVETVEPSEAQIEASREMEVEAR